MQILAAGSNLMAQFGVGNESDSLVFKEILNISKLEEGQTILLGVGANHTIIAIQSSHTIWSAGDNTLGQLGIESSEEKMRILTKATTTFVIGDQLVCGWDYSFIIDSIGLIWATGSNKYGLLGATKNVLSSSEWILIKGLPTKCKKIACGWRHTLFLDNDGLVFASGSLEKSRLDSLIDNVDEDIAMTRLCFERKIVDLACGMYHSIFLDDKNHIFVIGRDKHCVLLQDAIITKSLKNNEFPVAVYSGWFSLALRTQQGRVYTWGRGDLGQLGYGTSVSTSLPTEILYSNDEFKIKDIKMGSEYTAVLLENGEVLVFGFNDHGNLGLGHLENVFIPTSIGKDIHCRTAVAGWGHMLVCCD